MHAVQSGMPRFVIEHLPRIAASYEVAPISFSGARAWLAEPGFASLVRTTELISAVEESMGAVLVQDAETRSLSAGDEALLISLSFSVLLAWAEGQIAPLDEDWRCFTVSVNASREAQPEAVLAAEAEQDAPPSEDTPDPAVEL